MVRSQAGRRDWAVLLPKSILALVLVLMTVEGGAADDAWVGKRVIVRSSETSLMIGGKVVARGDVHRVYRVDRADGPWLWAVADDVRGWVRARDVIDFDRAIDYFNAELRDNPHSAWAYHMRGLIWYDRHEYDKAIADENEAISLAPKDALTYHNRGDAYLAKNDYLQAIADYNQATRLDPRDAASYENRALAWAAQHEHDLAIADLNEAIRLDPDGLSKYRHRAQAWAALHQYEHALADYDRALQIAPDDATALNGEAWIWATCPDDPVRSGTKAVAAANRACKLTDWKDPYDLGTLAAASAEAGDFDAAVKWQSRALELFPKDDPDRDGHRRRLTLYQSRKPWREASAQAR